MKEGIKMLKKSILALVALSILGLTTISQDALAKRRCPVGQEDINNVCTPKPVEIAED